VHTKLDIYVSITRSMPVLVDY